MKVQESIICNSNKERAAAQLGTIRLLICTQNFEYISYRSKWFMIFVIFIKVRVGRHGQGQEAQLVIYMLRKSNLLTILMIDNSFKISFKHFLFLIIIFLECIYFALFRKLIFFSFLRRRV